MKTRKEIPAEIDVLWTRLFPEPLNVKLYAWAHQFEDVTHDADGNPQAWMHPGIMQCDDPALAGRDGYSTDEMLTMVKNGDRAGLAAAWENYDAHGFRADSVWQLAAHYQWMCHRSVGPDAFGEADDAVDDATLAKWRSERMPDMDTVFQYKLVPPFRNPDLSPVDRLACDAAADMGHRLAKEVCLNLNYRGPQPWTAVLPVGSPIQTIWATEAMLVGFCWNYYVVLKAGEWTTVETTVQTSEQATNQTSEGTTI